jgi:hypothetical protein
MGGGDLRPEIDQPNMLNGSEIENLALLQAESSNSRQQSHALPETAVSSCPTRNRRSLDRLIKSIGFPSARLALERPNIPANYEAAINDPVYSIEWKTAIQDELQKFISIGAFKVTNLPMGIQC